MGSQIKLTGKLAGVGLFIALLLVTASMAFAQTNTLTLGVMVGSVDVNAGTITLANRDAFPATLDRYYLVLSDGEGGFEYITIPNGTTIAANGSLTVSYAGLIDLGKDDNVQLGYSLPDGTVVIVENFSVVEDPTAVSISNIAAIDSTNVAAVALTALVIASIAVVSRSSKES